MNKLRREWDVWAYIILFTLLLAYVFYLRQTCEELGCLAIIIPLVLIGIISVIEFIICIFVLTRRKLFIIERIIVFLVSGLITLFSASFALYSAVNN
ncbi:MAG: hypothetical protein Q8Q31_04795 [Nanoarchaeota archaeon]|nr:hypothetical protein [Nanoarchaeota archaeon]